MDFVENFGPKVTEYSVISEHKNIFLNFCIRG